MSEPTPAVDPPAPPAPPPPAPPAPALVPPKKNGDTPPAPAPVDPPEPVAAKWPEDWRERLAGDDAKELARLRRFASFENYARRTDDIENRLRAGMLKPALGEKASEAEVGEYRKAHGIPAEATMEGYGLKFPEGYAPTDTDKADVAAFLGDMYKNNVPGTTVKAVWGSYQALQEKAAQQIHDAAQAITVNNKAEIKAEMGRDTDRNLSLGNQFIVQHLGEEKAKALAALPLGDGTLLGDRPDFVRLYVAAALANADDAALVTAEGPAGGTIDEQYQKALALADTNPKEYHSQAHQERLMKLANARIKKQAA